MRQLLRELGVKEIINCAGTKTKAGGNSLSSRVLAAMAASTNTFVMISELSSAVGRHIAHQVGAESGLVTSGAASGVVLSLAACMTGKDKEKIRQLPQPNFDKTEIIIQRIHMGHYSFLYRHTGAQVKEIGNVIETHREELNDAISLNTAAIGYLVGPNVPRTGLSLREVTEVAKLHRIPVIVDAAGMLPPRSNLSRFFDEGADMVTFSGGKLIGGPQATGLLLGRTELIEAALLNSSPEHAIGRAHKISKEQIVGIYQAFNDYWSGNEGDQIAGWHDIVALLCSKLPKNWEFVAKVEMDENIFLVPTLVLRPKESLQNFSPRSVAQVLLSGDPRIFVLNSEDPPWIGVNPINLKPCDIEIVARSLENALKNSIGI